MGCKRMPTSPEWSESESSSSSPWREVGPGTSEKEAEAPITARAKGGGANNHGTQGVGGGRATTTGAGTAIVGIVTTPPSQLRLPSGSPSVTPQKIKAVRKTPKSTPAPASLIAMPPLTPLPSLKMAASDGDAERDILVGALATGCRSEMSSRAHQRSKRAAASPKSEKREWTPKEWATWHKEHLVD